MLDELPESTRSLPLDFIGGKRRAQGHVGHQVERGSKVLRERPDTDGRRVHRAPGIQRGAKARHFVGNLQGAARLGAFIEHRGHETGEARLFNGVGITAGLDDKAGGDDRQTRSFVQDQRQAVRQRGRRGRRKHQGARGTGPGHLEAPRLIGIDGLSLRLEAPPRWQPAAVERHRPVAARGRRGPRHASWRRSTPERMPERTAA